MLDELRFKYQIRQKVGGGVWVFGLNRVIRWGITFRTSLPVELEAYCQKLGLNDCFDVAAIFKLSRAKESTAL